MAKKSNNNNSPGGKQTILDTPPYGSSPNDDSSGVLIGSTTPSLTLDQLLAALSAYDKSTLSSVPAVQELLAEQAEAERARIAAASLLSNANLESDPDDDSVDDPTLTSTQARTQPRTAITGNLAPGGFPPNNANFSQVTTGASQTRLSAGNPPLIPLIPQSTASSTSQPVPPGNLSSGGGVFGAGHLPTGFHIRSAARTDAEAAYEAVRVIVSRYDRGDPKKPKERQKIRDLCTKGITPLLTQSKITQLLTSDDKNYDISDDAFHGQESLDNIWRHAVASDFTHILMIPSKFSKYSPFSIPGNMTYTNCVLDFDKLTDVQYFEWQEFIRLHGQTEETTSDEYFEEKLWNSLSPALHSEVASDFRELRGPQKGSISLLRLIINRVMHTGQESRRAMETYIKTFDIRKFPGEDVTNACIRIKAIARSLGTDKLPADIVSCILDGFGKASTTEFQSLCLSQEAMLSSSLIQHHLQNVSPYTRLLNILRDLEAKFIDLRNGHRWIGLGHDNTSTTTSAFTTTIGTPHDADDDFAIYVAKNGRLPFHLWVKDKVCHNCGEVGHIRPACPHPPRQTKPHNMSTTWHSPPSSNNNPSFNKTSQFHGQNKNTSSTNKPGMKSTRKDFVKALLSVFDEHLAFSDESLESSSATANVANPDASQSEPMPDYPSPDDHSSFFAALGCPKE